MQEGNKENSIPEELKRFSKGRLIIAGILASLAGWSGIHEFVIFNIRRAVIHILLILPLFLSIATFSKCFAGFSGHAAETCTGVYSLLYPIASYLTYFAFVGILVSFVWGIMEGITLLKSAKLKGEGIMPERQILNNNDERFTSNENNEPIVHDKYANYSRSKLTTAAVFAFIPCFGQFGIHNFILKQRGRGIAHIAIVIVSSFPGWIVAQSCEYGACNSQFITFTQFISLAGFNLVSYIWAIVEGILILDAKKRGTG